MGDCHSSDPGSNPGPGALSSLRIPTSRNYDCDTNKKTKQDRINFETDTSLIAQNNHNNSDNYKDAKPFENNQMRDLYNRKKKLDYWIDRIHKDLEIMQEKDQSILTITRCISIVIQIRKQIDKPLSKVTKEDIKLIFHWMDNNKYKVETIEKLL
jgi:hypothetical protein